MSNKSFQVGRQMVHEDKAFLRHGCWQNGIGCRYPGIHARVIAVRFDVNRQTLRRKLGNTQNPLNGVDFFDACARWRTFFEGNIKDTVVARRSAILYRADEPMDRILKFGQRYISKVVKRIALELTQSERIRAHEEDNGKQTFHNRILPNS